MTMLRWILLALGAVTAMACPSHPSYAAVLGTTQGTLTSAQAATGASTNSVLALGRGAMLLDVAITGTATVVVQQRIPAGTFRSAAMAYQAPATADNDLTASGVVVLWPATGEYQTNVTACTGCTVTVTFRQP